MDVTASLKRMLGSVSVLVLAGLSSCSVNHNSQKIDELNSGPSAQMASEQSAQPNAQVMTLAKSGPSAPGIEIVSGSSFDRLIIDSNSKSPNYKVSRLTNPARVVIDLPPQMIKANRVLNADGAQLISQVRLGAHNDMGRIVLDLKEDANIEHQADLIDGSVVVTLARTGTMQTALAAPINEASMNEALAQAPSANTEDMRAGFSPDKITDQPAADTSMTAKLPEQNTESSPEVKGLSLENVSGLGTALVADITNPGFYDLKRTAPSEYVLTLKGTALSPSATSTLISEPSANGAPQIRSVRPVVQGNDTLLRIFASPESDLKATSKGNKIIVSVSGAGGLKEIRGQMADDKAKGEKAPAAKPAEEKKTTEIAGAKVEVKEGEAKPAEGSDEVSALLNDSPKYNGRLISLDLQDTDIDNALRIIAEVSNLNIIASDDVTGKVTLRLIDVPWDQALDVILKTNGLDKVQEGNVIRIAPVEKLRLEREALKQAQEAEEELEPLTVKYVRISYAKASELKPLVESVITERGTVAYDERTNQLIVKDTRKGIKNVAQLVGKVDLRTPQVLLETQIVEATRSLTRELGSQLGFKYVRSPATGNPTHWNFPNSIGIGGAVGGAGGNASDFPATGVGLGTGSAVDFLFGSADGTKSLDTIITALESEGRVRVVSRPSVATINNKGAVIKSVEKIRVKLPSSGSSVTVGGNGTSGGAGGGSVATEVIELGIVLEVTPQASPDYFVLLDIKAKSSTFGAHPVDGIPSEVERSANSTVLVSSGQTFAMGGIYKISDNDKVEGVPFLKDIPFLGHLFRRAGVNNSDEELIFFITPRIVEGSFDDAAMRASS